MRHAASIIVLTLLLVEVLTPAFVIPSMGTKTAGASSNGQVLPLPKQASSADAEVLAGTVDWWTMYRHEPQHRGHSTSKASGTNQTLWIRQFGDWVTTSPAVHENRVFIGSDDTNVYSLNAADGLKIWNYTTRRAIASSPAVANGRVYIGSDNGKLYCLNETTGAFLWSYTTAQSISSSPCVSEGRVVFGSNDYKLYCLHAITGAFLWSYTTSAGVTSSPAIAGTTVFFGSLDFRVYSLNLTNGRLIWSYDTRGGITASPTVVGGQVFISSFNNMHCFQASDGGMLWNRTVGGPIHSSPAYNEGGLFFGCDDRNLYCLDSSNGQLRWNYTVGEKIYSSPAIADQKIYFGSNDKNVYCLNAADGSFIWKYSTGGIIRTSCPAVAGKIVYVAASYSPVWSGKLFAFGPANAAPEASNLTIVPSSPMTNDDLVASYAYYDEDGDPQSGTQIRWFKDGVPQSNYDNTPVIPFNETSKGQTWLFTVRPCDGTDFGQLQTSPEARILNSPPVITFHDPAGNPTIREGETQAFSMAKADADLDPLNATWFLNGNQTLEGTDTFVYNSNFDSSGYYNVTVVISDGVSQVSYEWLMVVLNVERDVAVTSVVLSKTIVGQGFLVEINATVTNQGGLSETFNVSVLANSTVIDTQEVTVEIGASATVILRWNTSGFAKGRYALEVIVPPVPWEHDLLDNTLQAGQVIVTIPGDANGDFVVNVFDAVTVTSVYMVRKGDPRYRANRDLNGDGIIDLFDAVIVTSHYGQRYP